MKSTTLGLRTVYVPLVVITALLISGCSNQSMRYPSNNKASSLACAIEGSASCNAILLSGVLKDPQATADPFIEIRGQVVCSMISESKSKTIVEVELATKAELKPLLVDSPKWRLSGRSDDRINVCDVAEEGAAILDKSYLIEGRNDGLQLHLKFQITQTRIELIAMGLAHHTMADRSY